MKEHLVEVQDNSYVKLSENKANVQAYRNLANATIASLILFNHRSFQTQS